MQTTEKEVIKYKQQIQLLLNKADTDDELINALRSEINNMKFSSTSGTYKAQVPDHIESSNEQVEITRLKRQCKQQADQLNTQDELIRELRFHIK